MTPNSSPTPWLQWVAANAAGELLGLGLVFGCGVLTFRHVGEPRTTAAVLLLGVLAVLLGGVEGLVVGYAQWFVLRRWLPQLRRETWLMATAIGAMVAWLLGMVPSTLAALQGSASEPPPPEPPLSVVLLLAAAMGAVAGLILSFAQWLVLRRHGGRSGWWLPANAAAWAVGMPWIFWLVGATIAEHPTVPAAALFVLGLGVAGALVGAVHGTFLVKLIRPTWRVG